MSYVQNLRDRFSNVNAKVQAVAMTALMLSPMAAFAQSGPNVSAIEAEFSTYKVAVVGLVIAFAVVLWAIRGAGLLKPR